MKLMPPKHDPHRKAAKPTPKPAKRRAPPVRSKKAPPKVDPDMDSDPGMPEDTASEEKEPATNYAAMARKSRPTVI